MNSNKYILIGSSAAALGCINGIRLYDKTNEITVISSDTKIIYSRPVIAEALSNKKYEKKIVYVYSEDLIKSNKLNFIENTVITKIDSKNKKIISKNGEEFYFEKLLIGTGGKPIMPPVKIDESVKNKIYTFTNMQDLARLKNNLSSIKSAVVVGAGFIGLEVAYALSKNNISVKIVELASKPLIRSADEYISEIVTSQFKSRNIDIYTDESVVSIEKSKNGSMDVNLKSGKFIESDIIIFSIGVKPDLSIINESGIKSNLGISINNNCETNIKNIFSAGDVTEINDLTTDKIYPIPLWIWAFETGLTAGVNMTGNSREFAGGYPLSPLKFSDIPIVSVGNLQNENSEKLIYKVEKRNIYEKIFLINDKITGFIMMGKSIQKSGILSYLLKKKFDVSIIKDKLLLPDFSIADLPDEWRYENE
ncbi:NAD(P)/FAD-dependent oxidoreductase [Candidatus Dependentiae bacterium]|nr:NAD(P)/FAD-dependent oxidoreductase [Candidatus Dependentiae bacterium]